MLRKRLPKSDVGSQVSSSTDGLSDQLDSAIVDQLDFHGTLVEYSLETVHALLRTRLINRKHLTALTDALNGLVGSKPGRYKASGKTGVVVKAETPFGEALRTLVTQHYVKYPHLTLEDTHQKPITLKGTENAASLRPNAVKLYEPARQFDSSDSGQIALLLGYTISKSGHNGILKVLHQAVQVLSNTGGTRRFIDACLVEQKGGVVHFLRVYSFHPTIHVATDGVSGAHLLAAALLACPYAAHCMPRTRHENIVSFPPCGSHGWMIKVDLNALEGGEGKFPREDSLYIKYIVNPEVTGGGQVTRTAAELADRERSFQNEAAAFRDAVVAAAASPATPLAEIVRTVDVNAVKVGKRTLGRVLRGGLLLQLDLEECVITFGHGEIITAADLVEADVDVDFERGMTAVHSVSGHYQAILLTALLVFGELGFMHGDLRLANIFVRRDATGAVCSVAIGDFGVARHFGDPRVQGLRRKFLPNSDLVKQLEEKDLAEYLSKRKVFGSSFITQESVIAIRGLSPLEALKYLREHPAAVVSDTLRSLLDPVVRSSAAMEEGSLLRIVYATAANISKQLSLDEKNGVVSLIGKWTYAQDSRLYEYLERNFTALKEEAQRLPRPAEEVRDRHKANLERLRLERLDNPGGRAEDRVLREGGAPANPSSNNSHAANESVVVEGPLVASNAQPPPSQSAHRRRAETAEAGSMSTVAGGDSIERLLRGDSRGCDLYRAPGLVSTSTNRSTPRTSRLARGSPPQAYSIATPTLTAMGNITTTSRTSTSSAATTSTGAATLTSGTTTTATATTTTTPATATTTTTTTAAASSALSRKRKRDEGGTRDSGAIAIPTVEPVVEPAPKKQRMKK